MKTNGKAEVVEAEPGEDGALMAGGGSRPEEHCGLGSCQPRWARIFESTHVFMVVFLSGWVLQGMFYTYFVSVITTIEKLFRIKSKTTGTLLAATEVGQICTALLLTYFAGRGHRPRWIACGMVLFALGCLGCALPHFMLGGRLLESSRVLRGGNSSAPGSVAAPAVCGAASAGPGCEAHVLEEQAAHQHMTAVVLPIFFACLFAVGVGQTAIATLGIPYIDDNVASRESPLYMGKQYILLMLFAVPFQIYYLLYIVFCILKADKWYQSRSSSSQQLPSSPIPHIPLYFLWEQVEERSWGHFICQ